jgi:DNA-binding SARP family transcriptional activator
MDLMSKQSVGLGIALTSSSRVARRRFVISGKVARRRVESALLPAYGGRIYIAQTLERALERAWEMANLPADRLLVLGPLQVIQNSALLSLPPSRKVRALLAYLSMAPRAIARGRLCEVFWDTADDPRSELRWSLSKLRPLIDTPTETRLIADREQVWIDTKSLDVDAVSVAREAQKALTSGTPANLGALRSLFRGDFLEGLSVDRAPLFDNWLAGQRHRFSQLRQQLLERLGSVLPPESDDRIEVLRECIEVAPFDEAVHIELVRTLLRRGLYPEAKHQIEASVTRFQTESIDSASLKSAFAAAQRSSPKAASRSLADISRSDASSGQQAVRTRGATLLVLPFTAPLEAIADADSLTSDIIFGFAKLRSISVIARGTAFSLRSRPPVAVAALVNAQYVACGHLRRDGRRYLVSVELIDPESDHIVWADELSCNAEDSFSVPSLLAARIIAGLDAEVHVLERNRALLIPPASLDAWQAYHRGLSRMYRITSDSNREAQQFFTRAIDLDPTFPRSYAGLSFTHFQNAMLLRVHEREREIALAFETAERGLEADPSDPAAHWAMGRALWLRRENAVAIGAMDQSARLSPNFASAHTGLAFVHCLAGDPVRAIDAADVAIRLSPLDPMLWATHSARTVALLRLGKVQEAADSAILVGQQAGAHVHAHAMAGMTLATAGRIEEARAERGRVSALRPDYNLKQFIDAFYIPDDLKDIYQRAAKLVHIPEQ